MLTNAEKPFEDSESLGVLNPYVREWFTKNFGKLTPPQKYAFKLISENKSMLVTAPTGSGKTLSAFLSIISRLFDYSIQGKLEDRVYCIYVSPLRALNNDIYKNLIRPLEEVYSLIMKEKGVDILKSNTRQVTIGIRTGDTPQKERHRQLVKPPNILVTTPESLAIMINSEKFVENLKGVEFVIIDEIHELANNKRGVHLALSVERLKEIIGHRIVMIGMGATLYPLEEAAKYLVGYNGNELEDCTIVDASWSKKFDIKAMSPVKDMIYAKEGEIENALYKEMDAIIKKGKTTLIFTNTRSGTERVVFNLKKRFGYGESIAAHHGSLSRESRLEVEELLKKGALRCVVSSTSLELGIDIGAIDNVLQLGSPKSVTRAIQRIGRAGHSFESVAKGEMIVLNRDDLVECVVMLDAALKHHLDAFATPKNALDVLAQHIVGMSLTKKWNVEDAYALVRNTYAYHELPKEDFASLLNYLAGNYVGLESRRVYGKIWYDEKEGVFGRRGKLVRVIYMLNLGTIPDDVAIDVYSGTKWLGNIEEEFLMKLKPDDVFTLGGKLYSFDHANGMRCYVKEANTNSPTIPPWFSEQLPLSFELANSIGEFRKELAGRLGTHIKKKGFWVKRTPKMPKDIGEYLSTFPMDDNAKQAIFGYFAEQLLFCGAVPNNKLMLVEATKDVESDTNYLIFHSLYGRRVNDALARAFAIVMSEMFSMDIGMMVSDNGFVFSTKDEKLNVDEKTLDAIIAEIDSVGIAQMLRRNIRRTEIMKRRFRQVAARSFMILRNYKGYKITVRRQQVNSQLLLKAAEEIDPNFPVIKETYREILNEVMDLPNAQKIMDALRDKEIKHKHITTEIPSPFSHNMITFGHADVIMMKERHRYLQKLHKMVIKKIRSGSV